MLEATDIRRTTALLAIATGLVAIGSVVSLVLFYIFGPPIGTINDVGNALIGVLSAALALDLRRVTGWVATIAAWIGAAVTVVGSWLVISDTTGFFLAGLVSSVGFALIGGWLVALNRSTRLVTAADGSLRTLGTVAGAAMLAGIVAVPGIAMGIDDMSAVPPWLWIFGLGWLGTYVLLPAWSLWFGRSVSPSSGSGDRVVRE
jgi:hypothetical protein